MAEPGLEFVWVGDDAVDPLEQAQTLKILVTAGIKTREEARAELGLGTQGGKGAAGAAPRLGKANPHHDEQGRFSSADGAAAAMGSPARRPRRTSLRVASNDAVMSDAGSGLPTGADRGHEGEEPNSNAEGAATTVNITCGELLESDFAICSSAAFEDDHHYRGLCVRNALLRNRQCLDGLPISPLLPD